MQYIQIFLLATFLQLVWAPFAKATEVWSINEWRMQLPTEQVSSFSLNWPKQLKVQTENQFSEQGYHQFLLRFGPIWRLCDWLDLAAYSTAVHNAGTPHLYREIRWEFEPTLKGKIENLKWSNRNRLAYRVFLDNIGWRYRNRTKVEYPLFWPNWNVFASNEIFLDSQSQNLNQNRLVVGLSHQMNSVYSWSLAWQNRAFLRDQNWLIENGFLFTLVMS